MEGAEALAKTATDTSNREAKFKKCDEMLQTTSKELKDVKDTEILWREEVNEVRHNLHGVTRDRDE